MTVSEDFTGVAGRFRGELLAHCYRMAGSAEEAEDLVQETYLRAWQPYDGFGGRSSDELSLRFTVGVRPGHRYPGGTYANGQPAVRHQL
jgi:hypothetical protein